MKKHVSVYHFNPSSLPHNSITILNDDGSISRLRGRKRIALYRAERQERLNQRFAKYRPVHKEANENLT